MNRQTVAQVNAKGAVAPPPVGGLLQRACACGQHTSGGECEECGKKKRAEESSGGGSLRRRASAPSSPNIAPSIVQEALRSPGQPLDTGTRQFFEPRFGQDFSRVRVHTDARAAESARAVNALAYTVGQSVVFGTGKYSPSGSEGRSLLAHELTHVLQQDGTTANPPAYSSALRVDSPFTPAEREAELSASRIVNEAGDFHSEGSRPTGLSRLVSPMVQRAPVPPSSQTSQVRVLPETVIRGVACTCDPSTEKDYDAETFRFIASLAPAINSLAAQNRVPAHAVAGAIADEYNTQRGIRGIADKLQDALISSFPEWDIDIDRYFDIHSKLFNTLEHDLGPANIKVRTALGLVQAGELDVPGSPANDVKVTKIIEYLLTERGTVATSTAVISKAQRLFGPYLSDHGEELEEAVLVEYFKQGDKYYDRFAEALKSDPNHKICPGTGGCNFWHNHDRISAALEEKQQTGSAALTAPLTTSGSTAPTRTAAPRPARPAGLTAVSPCSVSTTKGLTGDKIKFGFSSFSVASKAQQSVLSDFVTRWKAAGARDNVSVDGYASVDGPAEFNLALSCKRAEVVKTELAKQIPTGSITSQAHGETDEFSAADLKENRIVLINTVSGVSPVPPITPVPPQQKVSIESVIFSQDRKELVNNETDWSATGPKYADWAGAPFHILFGSGSAIGAQSIPITLTAGQQIAAVAKVHVRGGVPGSVYTVKATPQRSVPGWTLAGEGTQQQGVETDFVPVSGRSPLSDKIAFQEFLLLWQIETSEGTTPGSLSSQKVFVTSGAAHNTSESNGVDTPNIPTFRRLKQAMHFAAGVSATQADRIVYQVFRQFPNYGVCDVPTVPNNFDFKCPMLSSVWEMSDFVQSGNFQCITISRYVNAVLNVLGVPKAVEHIVAKPVVVWADPANKEKGLVNDYPHPGINIPSIVHPLHPDWALGLLDGHCGINNYEACIKLEWTPPGQSETVVQYYCGGLGSANPVEGFKTPREVLDSAFILAYYVQMARNDPRTGFPRGIRKEDVKVYNESGSCHTEL